MTQSYQPLTKETANPNAATAAAAVFAQSRAPNQNLSSAAAAAALKARPITPTNVSEVQTRRTHRRTPSVSSLGSRDSRRELHRSPSVGSMTDRTFRSPSPGRSPAPIPHNAPPVPQIPADVGQTVQRKTSTVQTQSFKTASQKQREGKGSWFGAAAAGDLHNIRTSDAVLQRAYSPVSERPLSPSSINFSYPRAQTESPAPRNRPMSASGSLPDQTMVYDANSRRMVPRYQLLGVQQTVQNASQKPVKKKKSNVSRGGSHLSKGTIGRTTTAVPEVNPIAEEPKSVKIPDTMPISVSREQTLVDSESDVERDRPIQSIELDSRPLSTIAPADEEAEVNRIEMSKQQEEEREEEEAYPKFAETEEPLPAAAPPAQQTQGPDMMLDQEPPVPKQIVHVERTRVPSESPARSARFAPPTPEQFPTRHSPPPRSLSPLKSALKSSSLRDPSPSANTSEASSSRAGTPNKEDTPTPRRKSRVQFDDTSNMVVGEAAPIANDTLSPILPSPQAKKPWTSVMSRLGKKEHAIVDEDETMGPRPTLPLFGSIRHKKTVEPEERPLVRPLERTHSPQPRTSSTDDSPEPSILGQSSDVGVGAILAKENGINKNAANISKTREPLPPVVTSLEGPTYISHSDDESDDEEQIVAEERRADEEEILPQPEARIERVDLPSTAEESSHILPKEPITEHTQNVPSISLQEPSPLVKLPTNESDQSSPKEYFDLPGGFPAEEDSTPTQEAFDKTQVAFSKDGEPESALSLSERKNSIDTGDHMADITEESEADSIYSDAYEDLSDVEGDGFLSLDAIVDTPTSVKVSARSESKSPVNTQNESSNQEELYPLPKEEMEDKEESSPVLAAPKDWDSAKAYWKSLSLSERRQLEQEAMEEAGNEAEIDSPTAKSKKAIKKIATQISAANGTPIVAASAVVAASAANPSLPEDKHNGYQIKPGTTWSAGEYEELSQNPTPVVKPRPKSTSNTAMRKSMRATASPQAQTGRARADSAEADNKATGFRKSMRSTAQAKDTTAQRGRPLSYAAPTSSAPAPAPGRNRSADGASGSSRFGLKPSLRRRGSDSSESSFTRVRPGSSAGAGFRSSMRGSMQESQAQSGPYSSTDAAVKSTSRFSLRSLSPTPFRRNSASSPPPQQTQFGASRMRMSMRESASAGKKSKLGFGKSAKEKSSKRASRFGGDSSDDDEPRKGFNSRFIDSSDDEEPSRPMSKGRGQKPLTSMRPNTASAAAAAGAMGRPIPPRMNSREAADTAMPMQSTLRSADSLSHNRSGRGGIVSSPPGTLDTSGLGERPGHKRRGSFMSGILRRKKDESSMISRSVTESAARKDTPLERSTGELALMRSDSMQRLQAERESSWPLPDTNNNAGVGLEASPVVQPLQRPATAAGPLSVPKGSLKKNFARRRSASHQGVPGSAMPQHDFDDNESTATEPTKKKKFSGLRKMLGIKD